MNRSGWQYRLIQLWLYGPLTIGTIALIASFARHDESLANFLPSALLAAAFYGVLVFSIRKFERSNRFRNPSREKIIALAIILGLMTTIYIPADLYRHKQDWFQDSVTRLVLLVAFFPFLLFYEKGVKAEKTRQ